MRPKRFAANVSVRNHFELGAVLSDLVLKFVRWPWKSPLPQLQRFLLQEISAGIERIYKKIIYPN